VAEALYAVVCAFLWLGLPFPPGDLWPTSLYLSVTSVIAATLALKLRRPSARLWYAATVLSVGVIATQLPRLETILALARGEMSTPALTYATNGIAAFDGSLVAALILTLGLLPFMLQLVVAFCCYRLRHLRHQGPLGVGGSSSQ
jgi:hypothetical protein